MRDENQHHNSRCKRGGGYNKVGARLGSTGQPAEEHNNRRDTSEHAKNPEGITFCDNGDTSKIRIFYSNSFGRRHLLYALWPPHCTLITTYLGAGGSVREHQLVRETPNAT